MFPMAILVSLYLILVYFGSSLFAQHCRCQASAPGEITRPGANEEIVVADKLLHTKISGIVSEQNGNAISDVFVEVFDKPDYLLLPYPRNIEKHKLQRRIAACVVGADGSFCFTNIRAGKYEVRFSKDGGWNHTSVVVTIAPGNRRASKIGLEIEMNRGT